MSTPLPDSYRSLLYKEAAALGMSKADTTMLITLEYELACMDITADRYAEHGLEWPDEERAEYNALKNDLADLKRKYMKRTSMAAAA